MFAPRRTLYLTAIVLVVLSSLLHEVEGRRKILRGRKTITRTYFKENAIPAWSIIVIVALTMVLIGGIMYAIMKKIILGNATNNYNVGENDV